MYFNQTELGKRIKQLRREQAVTQQELANTLNTSREHIARMETGVKACSIDLLIEIAAALNTSTDFLLMGIETTAGRKQDKLVDAIEKALDIAKGVKM